MVFMEKLAADGLENVNDCDGVEASWRSLMDENQQLLEAMRERVDTQTREEKEAFEERYADRLSTFTAEMGEVIQPCMDHEGVRKAIEELSDSVSRHDAGAVRLGAAR